MFTPYLKLYTSDVYGDLGFSMSEYMWTMQTCVLFIIVLCRHVMSDFELKTKWLISSSCLNCLPHFSSKYIL